MKSKEVIQRISTVFEVTPRLTIFIVANRIENLLRVAFLLLLLPKKGEVHFCTLVQTGMIVRLTLNTYNVVLGAAGGYQ